MHSSRPPACNPGRTIGPRSAQKWSQPLPVACLGFRGGALPSETDCERTIAMLRLAHETVSRPAQRRVMPRGTSSNPPTIVRVIVVTMVGPKEEVPIRVAPITVKIGNLLQLA